MRLWERYLESQADCRASAEETPGSPAAPWDASAGAAVGAGDQAELGLLAAAAVVVVPKGAGGGAFDELMAGAASR